MCSVYDILSSCFPLKLLVRVMESSSLYLLCHPKEEPNILWILTTLAEVVQYTHWLPTQSNSIATDFYLIKKLYAQHTNVQFKVILSSLVNMIALIALTATLS